MRKHRLAGLGVLVLTSSSLDAQTLNIDHQPVGCAVADRFPRLEARFAPAEAVATARVLFQTENARQWYAVAMKSEGLSFSGVLPKPKKSLKAFRYYIEVTNKALGTDRTADYTTSVVASSSECKGKMMAAALGSASVLLQGPVGAAALPAGFASTGVVAAGSGSAAAAAGASAGGGGGLSTGAVVGIVAGAGAAAAGVVVAAGKGGEGSSATSYTGPLAGQLTLTQNSTGPGPGQITLTCTFIRALSGSMKVTLEESNATVTGRAETAVTETETGRTGPQTCNVGSGGPVFGNLTNSFNFPVTGTPGNLAGSEVGTPYTLRFSGALSGGVISGTVTYAIANQGSNPDGGTNNQNGSTTFPVTLR
jgi:hypothetical protein